MPGRTRYATLLQCSLVLLLPLFLSACGQKGPLYLPDDEQAAVSTPDHNA